MKLMTVAAVALSSAAVWAAYGPYDDELPCGSSEAKSFTAENGYVKHTANDSASGSAYIYSFTTNNLDESLSKCGKWDEEAAAPHAGAKYYVPSKSTLVTSNPQGTSAGNVITFAGDELVIGDGGTFQSMATGNNSAKVDNLFMLGGSKFYWSGAKKSLTGNAHIRRADTKPVTFSANADLTQPFGMNVDGDADQQIVFTTVKNGTSFRSATYTIDETSDWSGYHGSILITNDCSTANYTRVRFDATELPARVTVAAGCEFKTWGNSVSMVGLTERTETRVALDGHGCTWTVGDFVVDADVTLQFEDTTSKFVVTNSLTINPGCSLTLKLASGGFDMTAGDVPPISLISFGPEVDLTGVTTDTFKYEGIVKSGAPTVTFALEQDEETGLTTLVARRKTVVIRESKNETTNPMDSHFWRAATNANDEACWTDGLAPHAGADYYLTKSATPPTTDSKTEGFTFAGDSLTIKGSTGGASFTDGGSKLAYLDFKDLRIVGDKGEYVMLRTYSSNLPTKTVGGEKLITWEIRGKTTIAEGATLRYSPYGGKLQYMPSEQVGAGTIQVASHNDAKAKTTNTGRILFGALNTNFTGRICFKHPYNTRADGQPAGYEVPDKDVHVWLYMTDGRNLGGPLPAFSHNALTVNDWGRLVALDDDSDNVVLDQANRGVCVNWVGQFDVPKATTTLTIGNPLTLAGNLYKRGAGTLVLASPLRFAENDDVADIGTPRANSNLVTVAEGALGVASARALDGAAITFKSGTSLVLRESATDDELAQKGLVNVLGDFAAIAADPDDAEAKIAVVLDTSALSSDANALTFGLVTLKTQAEAEALLAKLAVANKVMLGKRSLHRKSLEVAKNADETWTITARYEYTGLSFILR